MKRKIKFYLHLVFGFDRIVMLWLVSQVLDYQIDKPMKRYIKEVLTMAKCAVCGKSVHFGNAVSHSHRRSNKMWKPNIKSVRVKVNGGTKKMPVCTGCLRSGAVERA